MFFKKHKKTVSLKRNTIQIILFLLIFLSGCGYRFTGGGNFPAGIKSIYVVTLENRTSETGAENIFTNDLIYEITRAKKVVLTSQDRADAILSGIIKSMNIRTISRKGTHSTLERRVTILVDLTLKDHNDRVIWSADNVSENEAYDVVPDKLTTELKRRNAISALSKRLAERLYARLTDDF